MAVPRVNSSGTASSRLPLENADRFGVVDMIWRQTYYPRSGSPHLMGNYGSDSANHYNHVHITTDGGGFPTGSQTYFS